ncbi:hypothetical protein Goshw_026746, partial [Gossypium schwendimanii]|nr:hypothetical protein [Gossypium schwendimanii]
RAVEDKEDYESDDFDTREGDVITFIVEGILNICFSNRVHSLARQTFQLMDLDNDYYIIKFQAKADFEKVLAEDLKLGINFINKMDCSHVWRSIMSIWEDLKENVAWRIGNGRDVKFWIDSWLGTLLLANEERCRHQLMDDSSRQICGNVLESIEHVSRECPLAQANLNGESDHVFFCRFEPNVYKMGISTGCSNGNWVLGYDRNMGVHLVLDAELQAIIDGMNMAWDIRTCHLIVECDSKYVIDLKMGPGSMGLLLLGIEACGWMRMD